MIRIFLLLPLLLWTVEVNAADIRGRILDEDSIALKGATIALLRPEDSTMEAFAISDGLGVFHVKELARGRYLLQASAPGYKTWYESVSLEKDQHLVHGDLLLKLRSRMYDLNEVTVASERIPLKLKGDTVEYDAQSYRVTPNSPVEELLRKLPGIQVDEAGNIKSRGKDVNKVLVDGKEFFGADPKVATKNLPADAVKQVQTFDKKSDQSLFTGIDDGSRDQTINLVLKEGKRKGYFGNIEAGAGTKQRFEGAARVFRFQPRQQFAMIGNANNINQAGFSFNDYLNFNGGLSALGGSSGNINMNISDDMPMAFDQQSSGILRSAVGGLNYSISPKDQNRFQISYLANGGNRNLQTSIRSENFLPNAAQYVSESSGQQQSNYLSNRLNLNWLNQLDSFRQLTVRAKAQLKNSNSGQYGSSRSYMDSATVNRVESHNSGIGNLFNAEAGFNFLAKGRKHRNVWELNFTQQYSQGIDYSEWSNVTRFSGVPTDVILQQYQDNQSRKSVSELQVSRSAPMGSGIFLQPELGLGFQKELLGRKQGLLDQASIAIDSLSPSFQNSVYSLTSGLSIRKSTARTQWKIQMQLRGINMRPEAANYKMSGRNFLYLLPTAFWRREFSGGRSLGFNYESQCSVPEPNQMIPVTYYTSPVSAITGNISLKPEYVHRMMLNFQHFDQFTMSSFFAYLQGSYTVDKINAARTILPDLRQQTLWVNTRYQTDVSGNASYSRLVRPIRMTIDGDLGTALSKSMSPVNGTDNDNTNVTYTLGLSLNNRAKKLWSIRVGSTFKLTQSYYSIDKGLNAVYKVANVHGTIGWHYANKWHAQVSADVNRYEGGGFAAPITIPLLKAEITRFIGKNQRLGITLKGFDLLNQNQSVMRVAQQNYLLIQRANVLSRYFMLSMNFKLNKVGKSDPMSIDIVN